MHCAALLLLSSMLAGVSVPDPPSRTWTATSSLAITNRGLRDALHDLLAPEVAETLWPDFVPGNDPLILVDGDAAYCVGTCAPVALQESGSRVLVTRQPMPIPRGQFRWMPLASWGLRGEGDVVAVGFQDRAHSVTEAVHEDFHLRYQARYSDDVGPEEATPSNATRADLEGAYSHSEPIATALREECVALTAALRAGRGDRPASLAALAHFLELRAARRARPGAPSFEEDFWERQEGIPTNLERRIAQRRSFPDPSVIAVALSERSCNLIPQTAYFLLLGGLEAAVLDELSDPLAWPKRVYPDHGARAASLHQLIRSLLAPSEEK